MSAVINLTECKYQIKIIPQSLADVSKRELVTVDVIEEGKPPSRLRLNKIEAEALMSAIKAALR